MAVTTSRASLTTRSATDLARAIRTGETTSREVVEAHIELLERTAHDVNAIACERYADARAEADAADAQVAEAADPDALPPLLGVPITIKESIGVAGMPNCSGLVARRDHVAERTAPAAARLLATGAVLLGVTNTSELTMWIESTNRVYGRTNNAYDRRRIAGGSSGGEGAAVGSGGSPLGLGSDIGGSIRLPAFFNGVFGHKPTPGYVPNTGQWPTAEGEAARLLTMGPLARRAEDLMPALRAIVGPDGEDPLADPDPLLGDPAAVDFGSLSVLVSDDAVWRPLKGEVRDARERAAGALAHAGARVRTVSLKGLRRSLELYLATLRVGAVATVSEMLAAEHGRAVSLREAVRRDGDHTPALAAHLAFERSTEWIPRRLSRRSAAAGRSVRAEVVDLIGDGVLLHPPFPRVAPKHGGTVGRPWLLTYPTVFNLLGLPVTQVPLGLNPKGIPTGVQVAAAPGNDHVTIACALELERAFGGWVPPA
jgi:fatty acid amide hydrolase 2